MYAIASIVTMGFTPDAFGNVEASQTERFRTSHVSPSGRQADVSGVDPMRAVPIWWNE